jgi:hypothetical protein
MKSREVHIDTTFSFDDAGAMGVYLDGRNLG